MEEIRKKTDAMHDEDQDLSRLLRLKRFEQPPPDYFENFLDEFKDRQRAQMLREPAWRIAWDRLVAYLGEQAPARMAYGLASAAVLVVAGVASLDILENHQPASMAVAQVTHASAARPVQVARLDLNSQVRLPDLEAMVPRTARVATTPRYVMDTLPVSYEPPSSF